MKKFVAYILSCFFLLQPSVHAVLTENYNVIRVEKMIPFNVESDEQIVAGELDISQWKNVKILESQVNNGDVAVNIENEALKLNLSNGTKRKGEDVVKTAVMDIVDAEFDEARQAVVIVPDREITLITDVYGAFESASVGDNGEIILSIKQNAEYIEGYSKEKTGFSEVEVKIDEANREREVVTEWITLPNKVVEDNVAVIEDTSMVHKTEAKDNAIRIYFENGVPQRNTSYEMGGHTYFWVDRFQDGHFERYNPNSVYTTDRNKIRGKGTYLDEKQQDDIGVTLKNPAWTDFCGVLVNGKSYVHSFDKEKGVPELLQDEVLVGEEITFDEGKWNTEKYTVKFSDAGVSYIPEGKLYSMGELVPDTEGWGETVPNKSWESEETFLNPITNKLETYVKHFKFFYGPEKKIAFGGYYTYPYRCKVLYQHYLSAKFYSGGICYEYRVGKQEKDYQYSGYVKIEIDVEVEDINEPPTPPYHIIFHKGTEVLSWNAGKDDSTPEENLKYEVQIKQNGEWRSKEVVTEGKVETRVSDKFEDIRIRTLDEEGLYSSWGMLEDASLELTGVVEPYKVLQGESIDLSTVTKSLYDVISVEARNDALKLDVSLLSGEREDIDFCEISYELGKENLDSLVNVKNVKIATNTSNKSIVANVIEADNDFYLDFPVSNPFQREGTIILPNENGNDLPLDCFEMDDEKWYLYFSNSLFFRNKRSGEKEKFVEIVNNSELDERISPKLKVYRFGNNPESYYTVELSGELATKPVTVTWDTDISNVVTFHIFLGDNEVFSFEEDFYEIEKCLEGFVGYGCEKEFIRDNAAEFVGKKNFSDFNRFEKKKSYRLLILNSELDKETIKRYQTILENEDIGIQEGNDSSIYAKRILYHTQQFSLKDVAISDTVQPGVYVVRFNAKDSMGNMAIAEVPVWVKLKEEKKVETQDTSELERKDPVLGRLFYNNDRVYMEDLKKTKKVYENEGFICAGETLVLRIELRNTDTLMVDLRGNDSIKTLDSLTERFLCRDSKRYSKDELELKYQFPKILYPVYKNDDDKTAVFEFEYVIPYKTKQTLHSWSTLKTSSLEEIDTNKLFDRLSSAYQLVLYPNQDLACKKILKFDVFERWDTVLNRDVSRYLTNSEGRKKVLLGRK